MNPRVILNTRLRSVLNYISQSNEIIEQAEKTIAAEHENIKAWNIEIAGIEAADCILAREFEAP